LCWAVTAAAAVFIPENHALAQPLPCRYKVTDVIQAPDAGPGFPSPTNALAISPNGRYVVGHFNPGAIGFDRAFAYDTATRQFIVLPLPAGGFQSYCNDVNDAGLAVGSYWLPTGTAVQRGYVYDILGGRYLHELLPLPGAAWCAASGINARNEVCGTRSIGSKTSTTNPQTAFKWSSIAGFTDLGVVDGHTTFGADIAEDGAVAVAVAGGLVPRIWEGQSLLPIGTLKGADGLTPYAITDNHHVVGNALFLVGPSPAFDFRDGLLKPLPPLDPQHSTCTAVAVNRAGLIVGGCRATTGPLHWQASLWNATGVKRLADLVWTAPGVFIEFGAAIADTGEIVCGGSVNGNVVSLVIKPLPGITGDTNCDDRVDIDDLIVVIVEWGEANSSGDVNYDGTVDVDDLILVINNWTRL
jgi:hypothetical protein